MKVAQVCPIYYPHIGGVETYVKEISERLAKKGFEVEVLTTDPRGDLPKEDAINSVGIRRFKSWAPSQAYYFSTALKRYLKEKSDNYHLVHAYNYHAFPALYAARAKGRNKLVFTPNYHGRGHSPFRNLLHIPYRYMAKSVFQKAERVTFVSNYEKDLATSRFAIDDGKALVIPCGIDLKEFDGMKKDRKSDFSTILYVGRMEKYKGVQYLINALPYLDENVRLEIVGKGPYRRILKQLVNKLRVADRTIFSADLPREKLLQKYAEASLFVMLSRHEAYGIAVAEALAAKTPCIVATSSALTEWVDDKNCFGIDYPIQVNRLTYLIKKILTRPEVTESVAMRVLDWNEVAEKVAAVYRDIVC